MMMEINDRNKIVNRKEREKKAKKSYTIVK